jgi:hypothetical protein
MCCVCGVAVHVRKAKRGIRSTAVLILNFDTSWSWVLNFRFTPGKDTRYPFELEIGFAPDPLSTISRREKYYSPSEILTPDLPECSLVTMLATLSRFV